MVINRLNVCKVTIGIKQQQWKITAVFYRMYTYNIGSWGILGGFCLFKEQGVAYRWTTVNTPTSSLNITTQQKLHGCKISKEVARYMLTTVGILKITPTTRTDIHQIIFCHYQRQAYQRPVPPAQQEAYVQWALAQRNLHSGTVPSFSKADVFQLLYIIV